MSKKSRRGVRLRQLNPSLITLAMLRRIKQRIAVTGNLKIPAVPALLDQYVQMCSAIFEASGRQLATGEIEAARSLLSEKLRQAYAGSGRSKIVISFEAEPASPLGYAIEDDISTIADAYERWIGTSESPLFGSHPDARVLSLAMELADPSLSPVLDLGAGTGRNALALAARGHPVDAVEITPKFAEILAAEAARRQLPIRVIVQDVFKSAHDLRRDYRLFFASEVVPDFRDKSELRSLFELASEVLAQNGTLVFNIHLARQGFTPDKAAREFAQQCYSALFTLSEVEAAVSGLPFELIANDSVYGYEHEHLPKEAWPPTTWFINWVSGLDVYDVEAEQCPVELRWLTYRKSPPIAAGESLPHRGAAVPGSIHLGQAGGRSKFNLALLREGLIRRLSRRAVASGRLTLPAIPGMLDEYVKICFAVFYALGRKFSPEQLAEGRRLFEQVLNQAFAISPRSNIVVAFEAPMGTEVRYAVTAEAFPLALVYQDWLETLPEPIFGEHPDSRLVTLLDQPDMLKLGSALDIGAGIGRNSSYLAGKGWAVDAIEMTPKFAELLTALAGRQGNSIRVFTGDVFEFAAALGRHYKLILLSGVIGDFRGLQQLRQLFQLAAERLLAGGKLLLSIHLAVDEYVPTQAAREWGQQCCAMFFTRSELNQAMLGLPLELIADDSAYDFEQQHLPEEAWPPTAAYAEWALCQHMFALDRELCPIELRWVVVGKSDR
jgi:SAM-dependent methyltransferase